MIEPSYPDEKNPRIRFERPFADWERLATNLFQLFGEIDGAEFFFHAKYRTWTFGLSFDPERDTTYDSGCFWREGCYEPTESNGWGGIRPEVAAAIIRNCASDFLAMRAANPEYRP